MADRPVMNFRLLLGIIVVYLVIVNVVGYWQRRNGDHFYVCSSPSAQTYVVAHAVCKAGECTSTETNATGVQTIDASYTAGSTLYTNKSDDTRHGGCVEITGEEAERLSPVEVQDAAVSDVETE